MSGREAYPGGGTRSPRSGRRLGELPTVDRSPSRGYSSGYASGRGSPLGSRRLRVGTRSGNSSPEGHAGGYGSLGAGLYGPPPPHQSLVGLAGGGVGGASPYYGLGGARDDELGSPVLLLEERGRSMSQGAGQHRSRSASRPGMSGPRYASLDRASVGLLDHEREFVPIREPSLSRSAAGRYLEDELYGPPLRSSVSQRQSPNPHMLRDGTGYIGELQHQNNDLQRELGNLKKELELTNQKLGSSMHSIKTFWSPELKKERALRKEESTKYSLINEQLKLLNSENQELELRIETQKQTLQARDESIKKLLEMLQNKGMGKEEERIMFQQMQSMAQKQELKATNETLKSLQTQLELAYATTAASSTCLIGGSVAVPGGVPGSSTLTAILETKDARIQTLERQIQLLEAELQRIKECGGRLREQLLRAVAVPSGAPNPHLQHHHHHHHHHQQQQHQLPLRPTSTSPLFAGTGVTNPFTDHLRSNQQYNQNAQQQQFYQNRQLKQIEPAVAQGALALHTHAFNKHDFNFKRQVSFFIDNELIDKNDE